MIHVGNMRSDFGPSGTCHAPPYSRVARRVRAVSQPRQKRNPEAGECRTRRLLPQSAGHIGLKFWAVTLQLLRSPEPIWESHVGPGNRTWGERPPFPEGPFLMKGPSADHLPAPIGLDVVALPTAGGWPPSRGKRRFGCTGGRRGRGHGRRARGRL